MRVVQVLDLAENENQTEKGKEVKGLSTIGTSKEQAHDNTEGLCVGNLSEEPSRDESRQTCHENSPKSSRWEDVSEDSDEGTPERDLPGTVHHICLFYYSLLSNRNMCTVNNISCCISTSFTWFLYALVIKFQTSFLQLHCCVVVPLL